MLQTPAAKLSLLAVVKSQLVAAKLLLPPKTLHVAAKSQFADVSPLLRAANLDAIHLQRKAAVDCFPSYSQCLTVAIAAVTKQAKKIQLVVVSQPLKDAKMHVMQLQVLSAVVFSQSCSHPAATRAVIRVMLVKKLASQLAVVKSQLAVASQQHP